MTRRIERVNNLIRCEISDLLQRRVKDPRLGNFVTVTAVSTSPDLKYAKIFVSRIGSEGEKQETLNVLTAASGFLRREMARRLKLPRIPELSFQWDESIERGAHLLELIDKVCADKDRWKTVDGILNINKPQGKTSYSIVAMVKRLTGEKRVGHAGTLDPAATGVLPVCFGQATRIIEFLTGATKAYRAQIELGVATDTYDADGKIIQKGDPSGVNQEQLELALTSFRGSIQQTPPMYSAVKYHGKPLYELARAGIEVERKSRLAKIYHLELINWQPPVVTIEVVCGKGTYIRSLAHDLGQSLGCGANLKSLIRLRCGLFDIKDAVSVAQLEDAFGHGYWQHFVYPPDIALLHWAAMIVSDNASQAIRNGRPIDYLEQCPPFENHCRAYTSDGRFLGVLRFDSESGQWQPDKVFV